MKSDCRRVLSQIASYSAEELSHDDVHAFTRHLDDCPDCKGHWVLFEKTLTTLSQVGEAEVTVQQEQQMWLACLDHAKKKPHALNDSVQVAPTETAPLETAAQHDSHSEVEVLPQPFRSDSSQREGDRRSSISRSSISRSSDASRRGFSSPQAQETQRGSGSARTAPPAWFTGLTSAFTPAWTLALAGGAAAVLAAALLISPAPAVSQAAVSQAAPLQATASLPWSLPAQAGAFQTPPHATTGLIDYHAEMGFEPFSDHVAPTLVSTSATRR